MLKFTLTLLAALMLTSCSYMHIHKQEIVQGNVITPKMVSQVHHGMSVTEVRNILGQPMLTNLFSPNRIDYVYTIQPGGGSMSEQKVTCTFDHGHLVDIQQS